MNVSDIAVWLTIITSVISIGSIAIASVSKLFKNWLKSIFIESLSEFFSDENLDNDSSSFNS